MRALPALCLLGVAVTLLPTAAAQNATAPLVESELPCDQLRVLERWQNPLPESIECHVAVFLVEVVLWLLAGVLVMLVLAPLLKLATRYVPTDIDEHIVRIVTKPGIILVFTYGLVDSIRVLPVPVWLTATLERLWSVVLIVILTWVVFRLWSEVIRGVGRKVATTTESDLDDRLYPLFDKLGGVVILFAGLWFLVASFGVNMTLFAAGSAVGGLVIAFAAQDTLGNLFAGIFILLDRPFREGDRIEIQELDTWGDVREIGLRTTRIQTRDNRMVIIPNAVIGANPVVNHSFPDTRYRIGVDVGIAYGSDVEAARAVMIEAMKSVPDVLQDERIEALFQGFGDSALRFHVRAWWPHFEDKRRNEDKMHTALDTALRAAGIEIPFPQRVVHMPHKP